MEKLKLEDLDVQKLDTKTMSAIAGGYESNWFTDICDDVDAWFEGLFN